MSKLKSLENCLNQSQIVNHSLNQKEILKQSELRLLLPSERTIAWSTSKGRNKVNKVTLSSSDIELESTLSRWGSSKKGSLNLLEKQLNTFYLTSVTPSTQPSLILRARVASLLFLILIQAWKKNMYRHPFP